MIFYVECCLTCPSDILFFCSRDIWNFRWFKEMVYIWHEDFNTQAYQQATMSFKTPTLKKVIPSPSCSIIDALMKHTRILATPNTQVWSYCLLVGVANMRVCFMNGSMFEHDGLGITYFSVDILKDMVACWYAWVSKLLCQN